MGFQSDPESNYLRSEAISVRDQYVVYVKCTRWAKRTGKTTTPREVIFFNLPYQYFHYFDLL